MGEYEALFNRYLLDLRSARDEALAWWSELFKSELARERNEVHAKFRIDLRWPCGPASFPRVIAVVRQYYLECEALQVADEADIEANPADESYWGSTDIEETQVWTEPRHLLIDHL